MQKMTMHTQHDKMVKRLIDLSDEEFLGFGSDGLSYIKCVDDHQGLKLYALHSADGSHIATGQDLAAVQAIAIQNELVPVAVQ